MCEAVGHRVRRLHRSVYAGLGVDGLAPGEWRELRATRSSSSEEAACLARDEAHPLEHRLERRLGRLARLLGAAGEQPLQLGRVGAQLAVALLDRRHHLDDRLADVRS